MKALLAGLCMILTTLTACGTSGATTGSHRQSGPTSGPVPDSVTIVESNPLQQKNLQIDKTIKNTTTVSRLYRDLIRLPKVTASGPRSCPEDFGVTYKLTFQQDGATVDTAVVDPSGCRMMSVNNRAKEGESKAGAQFFTDLSVALGVPQMQLMGDPSDPIVLPLQPDPTQIVITKDQKTTTIKSKAAVASLVQVFNTALKAKPGTISCMAMTKDMYRITIVYRDGENRVFENNGGSCQPMIDMYTGRKFPSASILASVRSP